MGLIIKIGIVVFLLVMICRIIYVALHWGEETNYYYYKEKVGFDNIISWVFAVPFFEFIFIGLFWLYCWGSTPKIDYTSRNVTLYGLSNNSNVNGNLFLGTGTINNVQYVFYNAKSSNGYIKTFKIEMDRCNFDISDTTYLEVKHHKHKPRIEGIYDKDYEPFEDCNDYIFHIRKEDMNLTNYYDVSKY